MTPEIKHRIGQIRRGEMPEGYNRVRDSIIPSDWKQYCLGELGKNKNGLNFHREDKGIKIRILGVRDFGNLSVLRDLNALSEISMRFMPDDELLLKNGDIVFVRSNGSKELVGRNLLVYPQNEKVSFSGFCIRFRLSSDKITTAEYINLLLDNGVLKQKLQSENQGSNISNLNQSIIDNLQISIPCKGEQQKIATILTTQDRVIELKEKQLAGKQRQKKYLMQQLLTGKKRLPGFYGAWSFPKAKELFQSVSDKDHNGDLAVLSSTQDRGIVPRDEVDVDIKYDACSLVNYKKVSKGNFVISLRSFQGGIEYSTYTGLVSPAYTVLSSRKEISDGYYKQFFKSTDYINRLNVAVYGIRDGKQISYEDFGRLRIPNPPIKEQDAIAEVLSTADHEIDLLQQDIEQEKQKKKALMQLLLTGIVRVKI